MKLFIASSLFLIGSLAMAEPECNTAIDATTKQLSSGAGKRVLKEARESTCLINRFLFTGDTNIDELSGWSLQGYGDIVSSNFLTKDHTIDLEVSWLDFDSDQLTRFNTHVQFYFQTEDFAKSIYNQIIAKELGLMVDSVPGNYEHFSAYIINTSKQVTEITSQLKRIYISRAYDLKSLR